MTSLNDELKIIDKNKALISSEFIDIHYNIMACCIRGRMTAMNNHTPIEITERQLFICPPNTRLTDVMLSPDFDFVAIGITTNMLQYLLRNHMELWNRFAYTEKLYVIDITSELGHTFCMHITELSRRILYEEWDDEERQYMYEIFESTIKTALLALCNMLRKQKTITTTTTNHNLSIFNRFLDLLQHTEQKHKTLEYFASELCISTKYLTVVCKKNSGKTANQWITEYLLADITHYLLHTELSVKEIAHKLDFPNSSFFGKYVKEHFGCTPLEYRTRKNLS